MHWIFATYDLVLCIIIDAKAACDEKLLRKPGITSKLNTLHWAVVKEVVPTINT